MKAIKLDGLGLLIVIFGSHSLESKSLHSTSVNSSESSPDSSAIRSRRILGVLTGSNPSRGVFAPHEEFDGDVSNENLEEGFSRETLTCDEFSTLREHFLYETSGLASAGPG